VPTGPALDLAEATLLFRRLLGCTLGLFFAGLTFGLLEPRLDPALRLLGSLLVGLCWLPLAVVAAVAATRLGRELDRPSPWRYGLAAALPCPNLMAVTLLGSYLVPAWAAARESPLLLLLPRAAIERRAGGRSTVPGFSFVGFVATAVFLLVSVWSMGSLVQLALPGTPAASRPATASGGRTPRPTPTPDTRFYADFAAQGQAAFQAADSRLAAGEAATTAFGNTPEAIRAAQLLGEAMTREVSRSVGAYPEFRIILDPSRPFRVYVHARPERAAVLIQIPRYEELDEKTRVALLHFGWRAETEAARSLRLVGARRLALAVRGAGPYSAVTWGDLNDGVRRPVLTGAPADTTPVAAFFADVRLPIPLPEPSPGSAAARLLEERRRGPLHTTDEWKAYAASKSWDATARERAEAIQQYLTAADVEDLLGAVETGALPPAEFQAALPLLGRLADGFDARMDAAHQLRLVAVLRRDCLPYLLGSGPPVCHTDLMRLWGRMDRSFLETTFAERLEATKRRDQNLWSLLVETRPHTPSPGWAAVLEKTVRTELQQGRGAYDTFEYWLDADPAGAERAVLEFSPRSLQPDARTWLASALLAATLVRDRPQAAGGRLAEIVALGGPPAGRARIAREILGLDSQERIEALARRWRETRSTKTLSQLYTTYIQWLPRGAPFGPWRERLGIAEATPVISLHVNAGDSQASLFVETDKDGRLRAVSFD